MLVLSGIKWLGEGSWNSIAVKGKLQHRSCEKAVGEMIGGDQ